MVVTWCGLWEAGTPALTLRAMSTTEIPRGESGPRYVRLQAELVLEVTGTGDLRDAALARIAADRFMPQQERGHAQTVVGEDESEALAYLVDPVDLVVEIPGIELVRASWSCAHTEYDPTRDDWALGGEDDFSDETDETDEEDLGGGGDGGGGGGNDLPARPDQPHRSSEQRNDLP
jgi:hypothetical protein